MNAYEVQELYFSAIDVIISVCLKVAQNDYHLQ